MSTTTNNEAEQVESDMRSNAVSEIMGQAPNWVIRWGISVVLLIVVVVITGAALISYDDVIPSRITVTSLKPPVYIEARSTGKISALFVKTDQSVKQNELLAIIENTAKPDDIFLIKEAIGEFSARRVDLDSLKHRFPPTLSLGEAQDAYYQFITLYQNYLLYLANDPNQSQANQLAEQIGEQYKLLEKQKQQVQLFEKELRLSLSAYERNISLLDSGAISDAEFEMRSRAYLADQQRLEGLKMQIANTQISISGLNGQKTQLLLSDGEMLHNNKQALEGGVQNLKNAIKDWEQRYAIRSPVPGKVTLFDVWNRYQNVRAGTVLFTVVPEKVGALVGNLVLPVQNSGKVKVGQRVIIKIDNYPHPEWGSLEGKVASISAVPKQGLAEYSVQVNIEGLTTSFGKNMDFKQEMQGTAEIVTEELTVLQRIFYQLRDVLSRD